MASPRRVGAETSKTRDLLLDCVERLMANTGYAGVTYRAVAAKAKVTPGLVQYYFPTLDDLFIAAIRRRSEQNLERLAEALRTNPDDRCASCGSTARTSRRAALTTEFLALGNHRKSIGPRSPRRPSTSGASNSTRSKRQFGTKDVDNRNLSHAARCCSC